MRIIEPSIEVEKYDGLKIMKNIERACRTCYASQDIISDESYKKLLPNCIKRGHESILEHEKISVRIISDTGFLKDITRHRAGTAFSVQSTRYCSYNKDKFGSEIKVINPVFIEDENNYASWKCAMEYMETYYMAMANNGAKPDEMRMLLPHSTATEIAMTCNIREWRHILKLRCSKKTHPSIRQVLIPLLLKFKNDMPELFDDVEYDTDFPIEWYAEIRNMREE